MAIKIAEAVISGYYDDDKLEKCQPLTAIDKGASWLVQGRPPEESDCPEPGMTLGGLSMEIMKSDGRIRVFFQPLHLHALPEDE